MTTSENFEVTDEWLVGYTTVLGSLRRLINAAKKKRGEMPIFDLKSEKFEEAWIEVEGKLGQKGYWGIQGTFVFSLDFKFAENTATLTTKQAKCTVVDRKPDTQTQEQAVNCVNSELDKASIKGPFEVKVIPGAEELPAGLEF
jgi:hypothetical protein